MRYIMLSLGILLVSLTSGQGNDPNAVQPEDQQAAHDRIVLNSICGKAAARDKAGYPEAMQDSDGLYQFVIAHYVNDAGEMTAEELRGFAQKFNEASAKMGPEIIRWEHAFVGDDFIVGLYRARSFVDVCKYVEKVGISIYDITPVTSNIAPETAEGFEVNLENRPEIPDGLQQFIVHRVVPGAGKISKEGLKAAAQKSNGILTDMGPENIWWDYSYVGDDHIVCVYWAKHFSDVCFHADDLKVAVAEMVIPVSAIIGPETAKEP